MTIGLKSIFQYGISIEGSPTLWIAIPILTILGITIVRMFFGLSHNFDSHGNMSTLYVFTSIIISLQIVFGIVGYVVMKRIGYFKDYLHGEKKSPGVYALICPGVAIFVFGMFFYILRAYQKTTLSIVSARHISWCLYLSLLYSLKQHSLC